MVAPKDFLLLFCLLVGGLAASEKSSPFLLKKNQAKENSAALSKDALKERMGEAVRDNLHALFDGAAALVKVQRNAPTPVASAYTVHEKIIELERKLSRIAESLVDNHYAYKKNHKKRLEESLSLLKTAVEDFKKNESQLRTVDPKEAAAVLKEVLNRLTLLEQKFAHDACFKNI